MKNFSKIFLALLLLCFGSLKAQNNTGKFPFHNQKLPIDTRVDLLVKELTLAEKVSLLGFQSVAVPRLGIPAYNWWNEGLHGVARAGEATVFPQAIALAATFNDKLVKDVATVISTEARAKYNLSTARGNHLWYMGLTYWSPNINIFRDPRWGRGQETYGEDPYLTGNMGVNFVKGMQGDNPNYLKTAACAKHFAVHSGPEAQRHSFNAVVDTKDLRETYLPAFKRLVQDAGVESVMGAYNRVNGEPATIGPTLINILRNEWGFKGHLLTDCWALRDIYKDHKVLPNSVEVAAAAIKAGVNLDCSELLQTDLLQAVKQGLVTEAEIDKSLKGLVKTQFKLGFYDTKQSSPWANLGAESVRTPAAIALAKKASLQSVVLLKNNNNILPFKKHQHGSYFVSGANAFNADAMTGNYHGVSPQIVTFLEGITKAVDPGTSVQYDQGYSMEDSTRFGGIWGASFTDAVITVLGLNPLFEGEEGDAFLSRNGSDKKNLSLPTGQIDYIKKLRNSCKKQPIIAVITSGSALDVSSIEPYVDAILWAWYPGEQGGEAVADIIFGKANPSGRLPVTFYDFTADLPDYANYNMENHTYRYYNGKVLYPFGFGMSYTDFAYTWGQRPAQELKAGQTLRFSLNVKNIGAMAGDEVVQAYVVYPDGNRMPLKELKAYKRVTVAKGGSQQVSLEVPIKELEKWDLTLNKFTLYPGIYELQIGPDSSSPKLATKFTIN
jgi:beta-glucosidase